MNMNKKVGIQWGVQEVGGFQLQGRFRAHVLTMRHIKHSQNAVLKRAVNWSSTLIHSDIRLIIQTVCRMNNRKVGIVNNGLLYRTGNYRMSDRSRGETPL